MIGVITRAIFVVAVVIAPGGGYLVEFPTIRVDYGCVCLSVTDFSDSYRMASASVEFHKPMIFLKRRSKQGPADLTFKEDWTHFQGPTFFALFLTFVQFWVLG